MRTLVTGASGFVGSHLVDALLARGDEVHALFQATDAGPTPGGAIAIHRGDVRDPASLRAALAAARPERVFHLAAVSSVRESFDDEAACHAVNVLGTAALLAAVREEAPGARVLVAGSAEQYGRPEPADRPVREDAPQRPVSPYGASKVAAEAIALQQARAHGLHVVCARTFNLAGPRQRPAFVCADWARQLAAIAAGRREPRLRTGDLDGVRDFSDVRDAARIYPRLLERCPPGDVVNVARGEGTSLRQVLDLLLAAAGLEGRVEVASDPGRRRAADVPRLVGDVGRLRERLGEPAPGRPLAQTLADTLAWWERAGEDDCAPRADPPECGDSEP